MTKFTPELAVSICDFLCEHSVMKDAARANGISNSTMWEWISKSRKDPPELPPFEWMNMVAQFWQHIGNAKRIAANHLLDVMTERARTGSFRKIIYQGREQFKIRTDIPPDITDPDVLEMLYGQRDRYERDDNGHLVHLTEYVEPPVNLQLAVAAANFQAYQPHSSQSIEVVQRGDSGVRIVGGPPKAEPVAIEHHAEPVEAVVESPVEIEAAPEPVEAAHDFETGAEMAVEVPDRVKSSVFYKAAPVGSSKQPEGAVPIFRAEAMASDPPEIVGADAEAAAPADAPARAPTPDIYLHVSVRAAKLKLHNGERASGAVEAQIMRALTLDLTPEARIKRLQELTGSYRDAEEKSEHLGAGNRPSNAPVRVV